MIRWPETILIMSIGEGITCIGLMILLAFPILPQTPREPLMPFVGYPSHVHFRRPSSYDIFWLNVPHVSYDLIPSVTYTTKAKDSPPKKYLVCIDSKAQFCVEMTTRLSPLRAFHRFPSFAEVHLLSPCCNTAVLSRTNREEWTLHIFPPHFLGPASLMRFAWLFAGALFLARVMF